MSTVLPSDLLPVLPIRYPDGKLAFLAGQMRLCGFAHEIKKSLEPRLLRFDACAWNYCTHVFIRRSYSRAATISRILYQDPFTIAYNIRGRLLKVRRGNRVFPVVFPVGGASLVASPLRSDYPCYAPGGSLQYR